MSATPTPPTTPQFHATRATYAFALSTFVAALAFPAMAVGQTASAPAASDVPLTMPVAPVSTAPSTMAGGSPGAMGVPAMDLTLPPGSTRVSASTSTQPFVGTITADRVYVRSGPGANYYELGQLSKGDLVEVVASRQGWYQILPPNGTFCMVAKDFVDVDSSGQAGTTKADYVNVRAGTALSKAREPSAVLAVIRKGTKLTVLGATDKYYEVAPPEKAYVYISPQFVKNSGGVEYKVPDLKLPGGAVGPAKDTVSAPAMLPAPTVEIPPAPAESGNATPGATTAPAMASSNSHTDVPPPQPTTTFSSDAYTRFSDLNARYQAELQKPVGHRDLDPLIKDYKALAATAQLPPSVSQGTATRVAALEKLAAIQRLQQENAASAQTMTEQQRALQEQYAAAERAIKDYEQTGPYLAEGRLQTSTAVEGKYALVNPATGRVEAYVDPQADVDIATLLGKYIGVRGSSHKAEGTEITVIQVRNATLLPEPEGGGASAPAR